MPSTFTDLREVKAILEIDPGDTSEDLKIGFLIDQAAGLIDDFLGRNVTFRSRTQYYNGTGTQKLNLRARPVYTSPTIQCWEEDSGFFGQPTDAFPSDSELTYGEDFVLWVDEDDGTSRNGILVRKTAYWPRVMIRERGLLTPFQASGFGNIKVIYSAGYYVDNLPPQFRLAANLLIGKLRYICPLGMELGSESYEERSVSYITPRKNYLLSLIAPILFQHRNWKW